MKHQLILAATLFSVLCAGASLAQDPTIVRPDGNLLSYKTTWIANTYSGANKKHVPNQVWGFHVSPQGEVVTNSFWDEGGWESVRFTTAGDLAATPKDTHGRGGHAACADGTYWYLSYREDGTFGVRRHDKSGNTAPFPGGKAYAPVDDNPVGDGNAQAFVETPGGPQEGQEIQGLARQGDLLIASDARNNRIVLLDAATGNKRGEWALTRPRCVASDGRNGVFVVQAPPLDTPSGAYRLTHRRVSDGKPVAPDLVFPSALRVTGIGMDAPRRRLLVCDNGVSKQVKIYTNLQAVPKLSGAFGEPGGVYSTRKGTMRGATGDTRLNDLVGVGADAAGNLYVGMGANQSLWGADIRKFSPAGKLLWRRVGLTFVNGGAADPGDDANTILTNTLQFRMDWSKQSPGTEGKDEGILYDPALFPDDPRSHMSTQCATVRRIGGNRFLFCSDMYRNAVSVYRFDKAKYGYIAVPCALFVQGPNPEAGKKPAKYFRSKWPQDQPDDSWFWVDDNADGTIQKSEYRAYDVPFAYRAGWAVSENGDVTQAVRTDANVLNHFQCAGLRPSGVPDWKYVAKAEPPPAPLGHVLHARYLSLGDQMLLSGFTRANPARNDPATEYGNTLVCYDNWSKAERKPRWTVNLPYKQEKPDERGVTIVSGDVAGDYVFAVSVYDAVVRVYNRHTGAFVGTIAPGEEVGKDSGWVDIFWGLTATKRKNGEYILVVEEDAFAKIIVYRWTPGTAAATAKVNK